MARPLKRIFIQSLRIVYITYFSELQNVKFYVREIPVIIGISHCFIVLIRNLHLNIHWILGKTVYFFSQKKFSALTDILTQDHRHRIQGSLH